MRSRSGTTARRLPRPVFGSSARAPRQRRPSRRAPPRARRRDAAWRRRTTSSCRAARELRAGRPWRCRSPVSLYGKRKSRGTTPTTVRAAPSNVIVRPTTAGSPPKRRNQNPSLMTTDSAGAVVWLERAADSGAKPIVANRFAVRAQAEEALGLAAVAGQVRADRFDQRDLLERLRALAPVVVMAGRHLDARRPADRRRDRPKGHDAIVVGERQRLQPHGTDETEDRRRRADAEREHGDGDDREARRARERARRVAEVARRDRRASSCSRRPSFRRAAPMMGFTLARAARRHERGERRDESNTPATATAVAGSVGLTPYRNDAIVRVSAIRRDAARCRCRASAVAERRAHDGADDGCLLGAERHAQADLVACSARRCSSARRRARRPRARARAPRTRRSA